MPASLPALAAALARPEQYWPCLSDAARFEAQTLVRAYFVPPHRKQRVDRLADAVALLAERLDRLPAAYPHWRHFDACAFFDLRPAQTALLVHIEQLGATLDVTPYADLLSPAFCSAERFWADVLCPAYHAARSAGGAYRQRLQSDVLPAMQRRFEAACKELMSAGELLFQRGDLTFLGAAAAPDERARQLRQFPPGDEDLAAQFITLPSLTLSRSFDLLAA